MTENVPRVMSDIKPQITEAHRTLRTIYTQAYHFKPQKTKDKERKSWKKLEKKETPNGLYNKKDENTLAFSEAVQTKTK